MQTILAKSDNNEIDFLLKSSYESVFAKIVDVLGEDSELFASIQRQNKVSRWYGKAEYSYHTLAMASEEDKIQASELLENQRSFILSRIKNDRILSPLLDDLFVVPSDADLFLFTRPDGTQGVCLTRWGSVLSSGASKEDPFTKLIKIPKPNHFVVQLSIRYSDNTPYSQKNFYFQYNKAVKVFTTDQDGKFNVGKLKKQTTFFISILEETQGTAFEVADHDKEYTVIFPFYIDFVISVVDQKSNPIPYKEILAHYNGQVENYITDQDGNIHIPQLELLPESYKLEDPSEGFQKLFQLEQSTKELVFQIQQKQFSKTTIQVVDEEDKPVVNHPVTVTQEGGNGNFESDLNGTIELGKVEVGKTLQLTDGLDKYNQQEFETKEGDTGFIFKVKRPIIPQVKVRVIDHKNKPVAGIPMDFFFGEDEHNRVTDEEGWCQLNQSLFTDKEKVPVQVHLEEKDKGKKKIVNKTVKYNALQSEYTLKLKKFNWRWLLLLLLLLPLLLLIEDEKYITVQTIERFNGDPVPFADVDLSYMKYSLFKDGSFFHSEEVSGNGQTNNDGIHQFGPLSYTWYSMFFKRWTNVNLIAKSECFEAINTGHYFHGFGNKKEIPVEMDPIRTTVEFVVVDKSDGTPINGAKVEVITDMHGDTEKEFGTTDSGGSITFDQLPLCGKVLKLYGEHDKYYHPDSLVNLDIQKILQGGKENPTLRLPPVMETIEFRTTEPDRNNRVLPDVNLQVWIDGEKKSVPYNSGNGVFQVKAKLISEISIIASRPGYETNDTKIKNVSIESLVNSPQDARDIPMLIPPCNQTTDTDTDEIEFVKEYNMGQSNGTFVFKYDTFSQPDQIRIYCGRKDQMRSQNSLYDYYGGSSGEVSVAVG